MSKAKQAANAIPFVAFALVHWFHDTNIRGTKSFGNPVSDKGFDLPWSLANGWDVNNGIVKVTKLSKAQVSKAKKERAETVKNLRKQKAVRNAENKVVYETGALADILSDLYATDPVYAGNTCYRRSYAIPAAIAIRELKGGWFPKQGIADDEWPQHVGNYSFDIPIELKEYADDAAAFIDHLQENTRKAVGMQPLGHADLVSAGSRLIGYGYSEAQVARETGLKRGMAQKVYALARLAKMCPKANLVERLSMDIERSDNGQTVLTDTGAIPFGPLDKEKVRDLLKQDTVTPDDVNALVVSALGMGDKNAPKPFSGKDIRRMAKDHNAAIVRMVLTAVSKQDQKALAYLGGKADAINEALAPVAKKLGPKDV